MADSIFVFEGNSLQPVAEFDEPLLVADSFLISEGRVRSIHKHKTRFVASAQEFTDQDVTKFWDSSLKLLPRTGNLTPRFELAGGKLVLRLRQPADFKPSVVLWTSDEPDPRVNPMVKGPDLVFGSMLRRKSNLYGADEAIILDSKGFVVEGALSSLLWWRGDVLCAPDSNTRWLPSVTRSDLFDLADQAGMETKVEHVRPEDLVGLELWVASSFTGIRPVTDWVNLGGQVGSPKHLESFQRRLKLLTSELD